MRYTRTIRNGIAAAWFATSLGMAAAQTLATGDTRTVTEPVIPAICTTLSSQLAIVGGGPASETAFDTTRIQTALNACASGKAVELAPSGTDYAFLIQPITIPSGVNLVVDGGVTVFASRNPTDYQTTSTELCGTYGASGNGCNNLIGFTKNGTGSGIYGYGVIDGRGGSTMLGGPNSGEIWWKNSDNADGNGSQDNPILMKPTTNNLTLYKITLRNSPEFHVGWAGTGLTVWGIKISAPFTAHNTDGIDPTGTNVTIIDSSISDGDDNIAVGASSASANITVSNVNTYSGHGISVGSYTSAGLTNFLVENVNLAGTAADGNSTGLRLKSAADRGGLVQTVTYENVCIRDTHYPLQLNPIYNTNTGTEIPQFKNIVLQNVHVLTPTSTKYPYQVQLQGYDVNHVTSTTFDNVVFDQLPAANVTPAPQDIAFTLEGNVYPAFLQSLTGSGVTYTGSATATAGAGVSSCSNAFPYIVGELYLSTASATSLNTASITANDSVTLNAMVEPAMSQTTYNGTVGNWTGVAAPSAAVNFYEGANLIGSGTLGANGTIASYTVNKPTAGTHTYTAAYPGDSNYPVLAFGSVTVTVSVGAATQLAFAAAPPASVQYGNGPGSVTVTVDDAAGDVTSSTAPVTLTIAGPSGYSQVYTANAAGGTATFNLTSSLPGVGGYSYSASSAGLAGTSSVSETVNPAVLQVAAQAASRVFDAPNPAFAYGISGYVNNDASSVVTGAPTLSTNALRNSSAGTYPIATGLGTLSAANYVFATTGSTLTVTGGAPQAILFAPLANFASGGQYQLAARATSGLPVSYSVTGNGSISGATLSITAPGPVTVTASSSGNANYSTAPSKTQSFTAQ